MTLFTEQESLSTAACFFLRFAWQLLAVLAVLVLRHVPDRGACRHVTDHVRFFDCAERFGTQNRNTLTHTHTQQRKYINIRNIPEQKIAKGVLGRNKDRKLSSTKAPPCLMVMSRHYLSHLVGLGLLRTLCWGLGSI